MNPAQLLNPKAFAKGKAKKRAPNYGPQQTRKSKADASNDEVKVNIPTYDPKTLLAPKGSSKPSTTRMEPLSELDQEVEETSNFGHLYERHHNVKTRDAPAGSIKRKAGDDDEDLERKKQKSTFGGISRGGMISEHLKQQREALAKDGPIATTVDLTNDADEEVVITQANQKTSNEVCLGVMTVKANCTTVPHVRAAKQIAGMWLAARVNIESARSTDNIIHVIDSTKKPFGRIEPTSAATLKSLIDGNSISSLRMKAWLGSRKKLDDEKPGQHISRQMDIQFVLFAPRHKADVLGKFLSQKNTWLNAPALHHKPEHIPYYNPQIKKSLFTPANKTSSNIALNSTIRTVEEKERAVNDLFAKFAHNRDIAMMEPDTAIVKTQLMSHQKQALYFMVDHEDEQSIEEKHALWKLKQNGNHKEVWEHVITGHESIVKPQVTLGGILADVMGLGKTLSLLALIAATKSQANAHGRAQVPANLAELGGANSKATLIVCPTSVITNWQEQVKEHLRSKQLKVLLYHGPNRTQNVEELAQYHIVITSYGILAHESKASNVQRQALSKMNWFRIILDEAHQIRNANTEGAKAAYALHAQRRWVVTGTPVQNRLDDLGALIRFLRVKPFDEPQAWAQHIIAPFKNANMDVLGDLRLLVDSLTLRRTKETIDLPERREQNVFLEFSTAEQGLYTAFATISNMKMQTLFRDKPRFTGASYMHVLKAIVRLRQLCDHGKEMVSEEDMKDVAGFDPSNPIDFGDEPELSSEQTFTTPRSAYETFEMSHSADADSCAVCAGSFLSDDTEPASPTATDSSLDGEEDSMIAEEDIIGLLTPCFHLIHAKCKATYDQRVQFSLRSDGRHDCPECGSYVRHEYFTLTRTGLRAYRDEKIKHSRTKKRANFNAETYVPHTKIRALVEELKKSAAETEELPAGAPPIRSVVFTEWTTYLDLIEIGLEREDIKFVRLDGTMSVKARTNVLQQFRDDPAITVLIVSIRAGGQGLNFTAASKVYVMEPQFNPGVEAQAVDRVHRLGQERPVMITHFLMAGSVEMKILELQKKKRDLADLSMEKKIHRGDEAKQRVQDLRDLFK